MSHGRAARCHVRWLLLAADVLLFVGGVMNLAWVAGLAVYIAIEKLVPSSHWVSRAAGALLVD